MRVVDRRRHELGRLATSVPEHHALVASALVFFRRALVDPHRDVGALLLHRHHHRAGVAVEPDVRVRVPDVAHHIAHERPRTPPWRHWLVISPSSSTKPVFTAVSQATRALGSCARCASSTASETLSQTLSGWPFGHRLGREQVVFQGHTALSRTGSWASTGRTGLAYAAHAR